MKTVAGISGLPRRQHEKSFKAELVEQCLMPGASVAAVALAGLAVKVQTTLAEDPYAGHVFAFRRHLCDLVKLLWSDGDGMCLLTRRLERGRFVWPQADSGSVALSAAQLSMLLEGIYAREGVMLERSTLTDWVGQAARLLTPLAQAIARHVLRADKIHGDDTPIRVLGGKGSKAKTGRLWVYVRDDRPHRGSNGDAIAPPAVWFQYSANRQGEHPARHLKGWRGILQADAGAGYNQLYEDGRIVEAACWSHARRKLWDIHERQHKLPGTLAHQGLERIAKIFKIEAEIRGKSALRRRRVRQLQTRPVLDNLKAWMNETLAQISAKSPMALAIGYAVSNWSALVRFVGDGRIEAENNAAERALRAVAIGRKNFLQLGSDAGGDSAAVIYTLIGTAKMGGINPQHYLRHVLERIADHPINRIDELLPWAVADQIAPAAQEDQDLPLAA